MLDLNHPRTAHVFAASRQEALILEYCKRMTLADRDERRFMLHVVRPAFAALRWLNSEKFAGSSEIAAALADLERQVETLADMPAEARAQTSADVLKCPACRVSVRAAGRRDPVAYCPACLETVAPSLAKCGELFGTDSI